MTLMTVARCYNCKLLKVHAAQLFWAARLASAGVALEVSCTVSC